MRLALLAALALVASPGVLQAHPLAPSVLSFEPNRSGSVTMTWRAPVKRPTGQALRPRIPAACVPLGSTDRALSEDGTVLTETTRLRCDPPDLKGAVIGVQGLEDSSLNVVVRVAHSEEAVTHAILDRSNPEAVVALAQPRRRSFASYLWFGVDHLVTGWDHLVFVLGLLVLFGWHRRLIAAITAFTLGHSMTLALSVLDLIRVPQAPVEALIALTVIVLALEIQSGGRGPVWRHPWSLPALLGLLHGLGFASVLSDVGIPRAEIPWALLGFNVGIELGQLAVIACVFVLYRMVEPALPSVLRANPVLPAYVIGSLAAFWLIERTSLILGFSV